MNGIWKMVLGAAQEVPGSKSLRVFLGHSLHWVAVTRGPCCPLAWRNTPPTLLGNANMTQAPDAHVPHEQCRDSRFCYDLCCGLCCRQTDNLSSWGPGTTGFHWAVSALAWRQGRSMVLHKQGPGAQAQPGSEPA